MPTLSDFPLELLFLLCSYLPHTDILSLSQACRLFYHVAIDDAVWRKVFPDIFDLRGYRRLGKRQGWIDALSSRMQLLVEIKKEKVPIVGDTLTVQKYYKWLRSLNGLASENDGHTAAQFAKYNVKFKVAEILQRFLYEPMFDEGIRLMSMVMSWTSTNADLLVHLSHDSPLLERLRDIIYNDAPGLSRAAAHAVHVYIVMCFERWRREHPDRSYELPPPVSAGSEMFLSTGADGNNYGDERPISPYPTYTGLWLGYYFFQTFMQNENEKLSIDNYAKTMHMNLAFQPCRGNEVLGAGPPMEFSGSSGSDRFGSFHIEKGIWSTDGRVEFVKQYHDGIEWVYRGWMTQAGMVGWWGTLRSNGEYSIGGGFWIWREDRAQERVTGQADEIKC
ncbi:hypothetical protein BC937DRAFT_91008 [Endogone sp. FLAS-F59071]|nr:hypothetical protein BC937DRAFT_91008 [Endogone sp. FLAS-F59071]|eukprot:RUS16605.1 hypothetical protein BC937DRAFT_91008 [Endogone sp. FLAS-F59071]